MSLQPHNDGEPDSNQDSALPDHIRSGVAALLSERQAVQSFLQDREEELVNGQYKQLYESLRKWANNRPDLFISLSYALTGSEGFVTDVEADFGEDALPILAELRERYLALEPVINKIHIEESLELYNDDIKPVVTDVDSGNSNGLPVMELEVESDDATLAECRIPPSTALMFAGRLLEQTAAVINEDSCNRGELQERERRVQNRIISKLPAVLDEFPEIEEEPPLPEEMAAAGEQSKPSSEATQSFADRMAEQEREATSYIQ